MFFGWYSVFVDWLQGRPPGGTSDPSAETISLRQARPRPTSIPWRPVDGDDPGELFETGWPDEVFIVQSVLEAVREQVPERAGEQRYGFLLGRRLECPATGDPYLLINGIWSAPGPLHEQRGAHEFESVLLTAREEAEASQRAVLGWFHTHSPLMGLSFSEHDIRLHSRYFPKRWHCALVEVVHGEAPMGGIYQRRQEHRYPGTKLVSFLEVTPDERGGKWGEMTSQLDWVNYTTPRANVRRVAKPRKPAPVIRARGGIPGLPRPQRTRVERRQPVEGPSWRWLPFGDQGARGAAAALPRDGDGLPPLAAEPERPAASVEADPAAGSPGDSPATDPGAVSPGDSPATTPPAGDASPTPGGDRVAAAPAAEGPARPAPRSSWQWASELSEPPPTTTRPAGGRDAPATIAPREAGDWIASPLPSPIAKATAPAQESSSPPQVQETSAAPPAQEAPFTGIEESPPEEIQEGVEAPSGHPEEASEPSEALPLAAREDRAASLPFHLEPLESEVPGGSIRRAVEALRTVVAAKRRAVAESAASPVEEAAAESAPAPQAKSTEPALQERPRAPEPPLVEVPVPEEAEPPAPEPGQTEPPAPEALPSPTRPVAAPAASVVAPDEVPVVLPAEESWTERLVPLRIAVQRHWKGLAAMPILIVLGLLILRATTGGGFETVSFGSSEPPAATADLDRFEALRDALETSLSLYGERRAEFTPGEAGCIGLSVAFGSVTRDHEALTAFIEGEGIELPDDVRDEGRRLAAAVENARTDFVEVGCGA